MQTSPTIDTRLFLGYDLYSSTVMIMMQRTDNSC